MIYLFSFYGSLIALLSVFITIFLFSRKLKNSKEEIILILSKKFEEEHNTNRLDEFLDENLEVFLQDLKRQIPMGSMLFTGSLSLKIKELGKSTILKRLPYIKQKVQDIVEDQVNIEEILKNILKDDLFKVLFVSSITGFLLSFLFIFLYQKGS